MSAPVECPICMDVIEFNKNCVTTECGHCFHANCLMQSVAHNGFGCPYCRTKMAEEPEDDDSDFQYEVEMFGDDELRGFRFFWNNINGEEHDENDDADEQQLEEWEDVDEETSQTLLPNALHVAHKLRDKGYTYEDLVSLLLIKDHDEYSDGNDYERLERLDGEVFGSIRVIINNYEPEQPVVPVPVIEDDLPKNVTRRLT